MKRLEAAWALYRLKAMPQEAGKVQLTETCRAFYAGANALLAELLTMLDPDAEPSEADLRKMAEIAQELDQFVENVKRGAA